MTTSDDPFKIVGDSFDAYIRNHPEEASKKHRALLSRSVPMRQLPMDNADDIPLSVQELADVIMELRQLGVSDKDIRWAFNVLIGAENVSRND